MTYLPFKQGTLLIFTGPCKHLHIICNNPIFYPSLVKECFLAVNITSIVNSIEHDPACIFNGGEHPFIIHPSYVLYQNAEILAVNTVSREVANGNISTHQDLDDINFEKVLNGFGISKFVTPKIKKFYEKYCLE